MEISRNTCRLCLQIFEDSYLESVFNKDGDVEITKKIFDVSGVFIEKHENSLPEKICEHCKSTLRLSYEFRIICQKSDLKLKTLLAPGKINKSIKYELNSDESNFSDVSYDLEEWTDDFSTDKKKNVEIGKKADLYEIDYFQNKDNHANETKLIFSKKLKRKKLIYSKKRNTSMSKKENADEDTSNKKRERRRFCTFNLNWTEKYSWVKALKDEKSAYCKLCKCDFSIAYNGETAVARHMTRNKHLLNANLDLKKEKVFRGNGVKCEDLTIMCEVCGNKYPTTREFKRHLKCHSHVMDYECVCEICDTSFPRKTDLEVHFTTILHKSRVQEFLENLKNQVDTN